ncbi:hypothetical protein GCM10007874_10250 [Labrys miyagiensis]|uniref:D-isomer specific 2-hydroxyacid dehydrogenase NAD-binding domain-containing protein n=2 Tax=Labrys miyagiensis TaxID=346912 RepID=A0ABQ6CCU6_9HYPH|nr:hypothetical protein GCM10007874_10250 [Labrys miyagiensis]
MGHIGQLVASFLRLGFDAEVNYWSRSSKPGFEQTLGIRYVDKADLIAESDLISLHLPQDAGVILHRSEFERMKPGAILINTARSQLVDAEALYWALSSGRLAYAAFDGFYGDGTRQLSSVERSILELGPDRFLTTAHIGWRTFEADLQAQLYAMRSIGEFLDGRAVSNIVG